MFVKNVWYIAAFEHEFDKPFVARRLLDVPVIMMRTSKGQFSAMDDLCPHRLMPLSCGKRDGDELQCGYHGMRFGADGRCTAVPGQANVPSAAHVHTYPLVSRHGFAWIWMGNPDLADPELIPDLHWHNSPEWATSDGYHHVHANFRLLNDNLLDLSHETYVHQRTIGNEEEESIANYPIAVSIEADCVVRAHREMPNIDPPPFFRMVLDHEGLIHRWQTAVNLCPSFNITVVGVYPIENDRMTASVAHVLHLLTPETESSTHYFWSFVRNYRIDDAQLTEGIRKASSATFDEDTVVLEIQQKQTETVNMKVPNVAIKLDEAPIRARRLLDLRLQAEQSDPNHVVAPPHMVSDHSYAEGAPA